MPAVSKAQQRFMGTELARRRAGKRTRTKMTTAQLREYATTKRKALPERARNRRLLAQARLNNQRSRKRG